MSDRVKELLDAGDAIGALCAAVEEAGLTMTLYGQPVNASDLREAATISAGGRVVAAIERGTMIENKRQHDVTKE